MTDATWELFDLLRESASATDHRRGLTTLYGLLLAGRLAELRETTLVRNGITPEQAEQVAYSAGLVLPREARRAILSRAGTGIPQALDAAAKALSKANKPLSWVFAGLSDLARVKGGNVAHSVHTLDGDARTATEDDAADRFRRFASHFDNPSRGEGSHIHPSISTLTALVLNPGPNDRVLVASEGFTPTVSRLLAHHDVKVLHFQAKNEQARREATLLGLLLPEASVEPVEGEPLLRPLTNTAGELQRFDRQCLEPPMGLKLGARDVDRLNEDAFNRFRFGNGLHRNTRALALAQHAIATLEPGGCATLLAAAGVLFRGGREGDMRRALIEADAVEAIIALPGGAVEGSMVETVLLKLVAHKPAARRGQVLFVNVPSPEARDEPALSHAVINQIRTAIETWSGRPRFARVVTIDEMAEQGFVLQPIRFIDDFAPPPPLDWDKERAHLAIVEEAAQAHAADVDELLDNPPA